MPLYEYSCSKCDHTFEALVFGDESVECPQCQTTRVERLLSVPARPQTARSSLPTSCRETGS